MPHVRDKFVPLKNYKSLWPKKVARAVFKGAIHSHVTFKGENIMSL